MFWRCRCPSRDRVSCLLALMPDSPKQSTFLNLTGFGVPTHPQASSHTPSTSCPQNHDPPDQKACCPIAASCKAPARAEGPQRHKPKLRAGSGCAGQ